MTNKQSKETKKIEDEFDLKHVNKHQFCPACQKMYLYQIKTLEKRIEILTDMLTMEHLAKPIIFQVSEGTEFIK